MMHDDRDLRDAARTGARRAGYHLIRAGWEVLAGVGAFLEEVRKVVREDEGDTRPGPQHIPVEED